MPTTKYTTHSGLTNLDYLTGSYITRRLLSVSSDYTWTNWDDDWCKDPISGSSVATLCFKWLKTISPEQKLDIWLWGGSGFGKDHMGTVLATFLAHKWDWIPDRLDFEEAIMQDKRSFGGKDVPVNWSRYIDADVLLVSDPDGPPYTLFVNEQLAALVRGRRNKVTIWTANTSPKEFGWMIQKSTRWDEQRGHNESGTRNADLMIKAAGAIRSRLSGRVATIVWFQSKYGDWRKVHGRGCL
jgi:hypothetical protein